MSIATELDQLTNAVLSQQRQIDRDIGQARAIAEQGKKVKGEIDQLTLLVESCDEAIGILNSFADERAAEAQRKIETLVTHGLQSIFGPDLRFRIINAIKAKRAEAEFVVESQYQDSTITTSVMDARGGGVASVAGFLLRLVVALLRADVRRILFLDESFAMVSSEYEEALVNFVRELVDQTDVQIVLVTHSATDLWISAADKAYRTSLDQGRTVLKELK